MWVKICGVTSTEDALVVKNCGADAVGLNFFRGSKRFVDTSTAKSIRDALGDGIEIVGVFVNSTADDVCRTLDAVGLTGVQFHGDEPPEVIHDVQTRRPNARLIRAVRVGSDGAAIVSEELRRLSDAGIALSAILVDAFVAGEYGGTGHRVATEFWKSADRECWPPLILAGGLTPENVASAVGEVQPWGIDTASGVELSPGRKSSDKVRAFVNAARS